MSNLTFNYDRVSDLRPCFSSFHAASEMLGGVAAWKAHGFTFREMADAGIPFDDLVWLASKVSQKDPDIERRLRLWSADCAAHVLPIIKQSLWLFPNLCQALGGPKADAWDVEDVWTIAWEAKVVAWGTVGNAEAAWQLDRLCLWMSEQEPQAWPLPAESEGAAA